MVFLERLKQFGIGCHVGLTYAGAFGYADDEALLAPSLNGLKCNICEIYAEEYCIIFTML